MSNTSENTLRACMKSRHPVMLVGAPGTAKTATIKAMAKELGYELVTIIASRMDPQDISGFPTRGEIEVQDAEGATRKVPMTEYAPQHWQHEIMKKRNVILFFDEYGNAHPSVRASLLSFIQDRQFPNGEFFPEETIIVGAMNPTDSGADGYEMDKATTNRMTFISWKPDNDSWLKGMLDNWDQGVKDENEKKWRNLIVRFLKDEPGLIHKENDFEVNTGEAYGFDITNSSDLSVLQMSWASRRSWDNLSKILGNAEGDPFTEDILMAGTVGASAATAFRAWLAKHGSLNVASIIKAPRKFDGWEDLSMDDMNIVLSSACDAANSKNVDQVIDIFRIVAEIGKESFAAAHIKRFINVHHNIVDINAERRIEIKKEIREVARMYSKISKNSHSVERRVPVKK